MRFLEYVLSNCMKFVLKKFKNDSIWEKVGEEFKAEKKIIEDSKRFGWNTLMPNTYHLLQDIEIRFVSNFLVAKTFSNLPTKCGT